MTHEELRNALARSPWAIATVPTIALPVSTGPALCILDTARFGRRFIPFSYMLRAARTEKRLTETDLANSIGKTRSLICKLEAQGQDKFHAAIDIIFTLAVGVGLEPAECYIAYTAEIRPNARVLFYPDDPGNSGRTFGLPLPGFDSRLRTPRPLPR